MGNYLLCRKAAEAYAHVLPDPDTSRGYTKVWTMVPDKPDRHHKNKRYDKFRELPDALRPVWAVAVAEVNMVMAAATADHEVHLWDLQDCELKVTMRGHTGQVWEVKFSTNESVLATGSSDYTVRLWDTDSGSPLGVLRGHSAAIRCLAFSWSGYLISGDMDSNLFLWEAENPVPIKEWQAHDGSVHSVSFSLADDLMALSVGADGSVAAWFVSRFENRELDDCVIGGRFAGGDGGAVLSVAAHPKDAGTVAVGNQDGGVWLWFFTPNFKTGKAEVTGHNRLRGHKGAVWFVEFSKDSCLLASGSSDKTVRVWDCSKIECPSLTAVFNAHESWVKQVRFYGKRRALVTCSTDGTVSVWAAPGRLKKLKAEGKVTVRSKMESLDDSRDISALASTGGSLAITNDSQETKNTTQDTLPPLVPMTPLSSALADQSEEAPGESSSLLTAQTPPPPPGPPAQAGTMTTLSGSLPPLESFWGKPKLPASSSPGPLRGPGGLPPPPPVPPPKARAPGPPGPPRPPQ
eukprot:TRINITY_DN11702_c0_g2_i1.p1 TRINITY_DN11702_c0_g2~~TRINITY_DN11702_c0_g2_i1.p1  ORF type:complete len:519 (-),score=86.91 TRINITY_DN11702_c0_g2_i1:935-2491(-)